MAVAGSPHLESHAPAWTKPDDSRTALDVSIEDERSIWRDTWWPVGRLVELKENEPNATQLLGMDLVLWKDAQGTWRAAQDECPHRSDHSLWKIL